MISPTAVQVISLHQQSCLIIMLYLIDIAQLCNESDHSFRVNYTRLLSEAFVIRRCLGTVFHYAKMFYRHQYIGETTPLLSKFYFRTINLSTFFNIITRFARYFFTICGSPTVIISLC